MADVTLERRGAAAWVTFDRPEAHNAMTFAMYDRLVEHCETVDADDDVSVMVLRGAGGKAFVAGTDIRQFAEFKTAQDGLSTRRGSTRCSTAWRPCKKPTIALVDGFAMGSGLAISAACDLRVITPDAKFGMPIARTVGNCLSMANYARLAQALGAARLKDVIFRARADPRRRGAGDAASPPPSPTTPKPTSQSSARPSPATRRRRCRSPRKPSAAPATSRRATTSSSRPTAPKASAPTWPAS